MAYGMNCTRKEISTLENNRIEFTFLDMSSTDEYNIEIVIAEKKEYERACELLQSK